MPNANFSLSFFHFYTVSSVLVNVGAGVSSCDGDCGACQGGGADYFDCEGLVLSVVVTVELWWLCGWVMMLMKQSSVLTQQHMFLWYEMQNCTICHCSCGNNSVTAIVAVVIVSVVFHLSSLCFIMKVHILCVK